MASETEGLTTIPASLSGVTIDTIRAAAERIRPHAHRTPIQTSRSINRMAGADVFFKCENLQRVGAFKFRGACNAVFSLDEEEAACGVATHSSGNHAQALALAASLRGIPAGIVMPENSPRAKIDAVREYGGRIAFCEPTLSAREERLATLVGETGATFIHPYNDDRVISGQGTAALELLEEIPGLDILLVPVGGGGLLSGTLVVAHHSSPGTKVIAGEPAGADDACRSLQEGRIIPSISPHTVADGLLTSLGDRTFSIIQRHVTAIVTVSEEDILHAMRTVWERMKTIIEPSAAVPVAVMMGGKIDVSGKRVGIILSGGNLDLDALPWQGRKSQTVS